MDKTSFSMPRGIILTDSNIQGKKYFTEWYKKTSTEL